MTCNNSRIYELTQIEKNVLIGSLLGDGSLALYGRSKNAYYREHGCIAQVPYREWKLYKLRALDFKLLRNCKYPKLCSPSNKIYTDLYNMFYISKIKTITNENIKTLDHPVGLACLYMDDGSLVIDSSKRTNGSIYIFPRISLYTLSFSKEENEILKDHLKIKFNVETKLKKRRDGKNYLLEINKKIEVLNFLNIIKPFVEEIPCMNYKINVEQRFNDKRASLKNQGYTKINQWKSDVLDNSYSIDQEKLIITLKKNGTTDKEISEILNRSYWGIVDKIRRLNKVSF